MYDVRVCSGVVLVGCDLYVCVCMRMCCLNVIASVGAVLCFAKTMKHNILDFRWFVGTLSSMNKDRMHFSMKMKNNAKN